MSSSVVLAEQPTGQMYPRAHSEVSRGKTNAFLQVRRQTYTYIDKCNCINQGQYERIPACELYETCQVCLCKAKTYQPGILRNHAAWWIGSQFKAASVGCTCEFQHDPCLRNTNLMLVNAMLNREGQCSEFHKVLLRMGATDCWMQCMMSLQSSWASHWHVREITDDWPCCICCAFCQHQWNHIDAYIAHLIFCFGTNLTQNKCEMKHR